MRVQKRFRDSSEAYYWPLRTNGVLDTPLAIKSKYRENTEVRPKSKKEGERKISKRNEVKGKVAEA